MTDPVGFTITQLPARTVANSPFQGVTDKTMKEVERINRDILKLTEGDTENVNRLEKSDLLREEQSVGETLQTMAKDFRNDVDNVMDYSSAMAKFAVGMSATQSTGRHFQSFLKGQ